MRFLDFGRHALGDFLLLWAMVINDGAVFYDEHEKYGEINYTRELTRSNIVSLAVHGRRIVCPIEEFYQFNICEQWIHGAEQVCLPTSSSYVTILGSKVMLTASAWSVALEQTSR